MCVCGLFVFDGLKDLGAINGGSALLDNGIADLSDEDNETGGSVVVLGVVPDK